MAKQEKVSGLSLGLTFGILGMFYLFVVSIYPMLSQAIMGITKGQMMVDMMMDIYPFYGIDVWYGVFVGMVFAFADGFIFGVLTGWLYNAFHYKK